MRRDIRSTVPLDSTFLFFEKDVETILRALFVQSYPHSEKLKRLLVLNTSDCLDNEESEVYKEILKETNLKTLIDDGYIRLSPKIRMYEHEEVRSYIMISSDNFFPNGRNPHFRDYTITFDIICHIDQWYLGDYRIRPLKIAGYIDSLLDGAKLSGIGQLNFMSGNELILNEDLAGYSLTYRMVQGNEDRIPPKE